MFNSLVFVGKVRMRYRWRHVVDGLRVAWAGVKGFHVAGFDHGSSGNKCNPV